MPAIQGYRMFDPRKKATRRYPDATWEWHREEILDHLNQYSVQDIATRYRLIGSEFQPTPDQLSRHIKRWRTEQCVVLPAQNTLEAAEQHQCPEAEQPPTSQSRADETSIHWASNDADTIVLPNSLPSNMPADVRVHSGEKVAVEHSSINVKLPSLSNGSKHESQSPAPKVEDRPEPEWEDLACVRKGSHYFLCGRYIDLDDGRLCSRYGLTPNSSNRPYPPSARLSPRKIGHHQHRLVTDRTSHLSQPTPPSFQAFRNSAKRINRELDTWALTRGSPHFTSKLSQVTDMMSGLSMTVWKEVEERPEDLELELDLEVEPASDDETSPDSTDDGDWVLGEASIELELIPDDDASHDSTVNSY